MSLGSAAPELVLAGSVTVTRRTQKLGHLGFFFVDHGQHKAASETENLIPKRKAGRTPSLQLFTAYPGERWSSERRMFGMSLGPRCPDLPGLASVNCSESRDRKQPWLRFHSSSSSTTPCQKHRPTRDCAIQQLPILDTDLKKQGAEKNWRPNASEAARLGSESWDFPPALQPDRESILPLRMTVIIIKWDSGLQNPLIFAPSSEREEFRISFPLLRVT